MLLAAAYPTQIQRLSPDETKAWAEIYGRSIVDLELGAARAAVERLVRTSTWLPTIAELREAAVHVNGGRRRAGAEAWGDVAQMIGRWGQYREPGVDFDFDDALVAKLVRDFGWRRLCQSEDITADRARFITAYDQLAIEQRKDAAASPGARGALPAAPAQRRQLAKAAGVSREERAAAAEELRLARAQLESDGIVIDLAAHLRSKL